MWMNQYEVEFAKQRASDPVTVKAATFLANFCELINSISDGWAYWSYGVRCSNDLQEIVNNSKDKGWQQGTQPKPAEVAKACKKVCAFLRRCDQTKGKPEVLAFLEANEVQP